MEAIDRILLDGDAKKESLRSYLLEHCGDNGYPLSDDGIYEMLRDANNISGERVDSHRHWDDYRYTVRVGDRLIGYIDEYSTGDRSGDLGFIFDPNTICEMKEVEKTITVYAPISEKGEK